MVSKLQFILNRKWFVVFLWIKSLRLTMSAKCFHCTRLAPLQARQHLTECNQNIVLCLGLGPSHLVLIFLRVQSYLWCSVEAALLPRCWGLSTDTGARHSKSASALPHWCWRCIKALASSTNTRHSQRRPRSVGAGSSPHCFGAGIFGWAGAGSGRGGSGLAIPIQGWILCPLQRPARPQFRPWGLLRSAPAI